MDINTTLDNIDRLSDDNLWILVSLRLPANEAECLHFLGSEEKRTSLTLEEKYQFDQLLAQVNSDMLLRSKALLLLKERGHDITTYLRTKPY